MALEHLCTPAKHRVPVLDLGFRWVAVVVLDPVEQVLVRCLSALPITLPDFRNVVPAVDNLLCCLLCTRIQFPHRHLQRRVMRLSSVTAITAIVEAAMKIVHCACQLIVSIDRDASIRNRELSCLMRSAVSQCGYGERVWQHPLSNSLQPLEANPGCLCFIWLDQRQCLLWHEVIQVDRLAQRGQRNVRERVYFLVKDVHDHRAKLRASCFQKQNIRLAVSHELISEVELQVLHRVVPLVKLLNCLL